MVGSGLGGIDEKYLGADVGADADDEPLDVRTGAVVEPYVPFVQAEEWGVLEVPQGSCQSRVYFWGTWFSGGPHFDNVTRRHEYSWGTSGF